MRNITHFDVLVVYTRTNAISASSTDSETPFRRGSKRAHYNNAYAYFLEMCAKNNLRAALTTTRDLGLNKTFSSHWLYQKNSWIKVNKKCYASLIFDKFSGKRSRLFSGYKIRSFNSPSLFSLFSDKQNTYDNLKDFTIPTVPIEGRDKRSVNQAVDTLKLFVALHPNSQDFSNKIILKDRFGAGGNRIFAINSRNQKEKISEILKNFRRTAFVIQPFTKFEHGFTYKNYSGFIDIRVIYMKDKIVQVYLRVAKEKDFRCNEHQGGALEYIPVRDLPKIVKQVSTQIVKILDEKDSLFALDFVISDSGNVYLMEGNNGPGIDWNLSLKKNERMAKKLIRLITEELALRARQSRVAYRKDRFPSRAFIHN